MYSQPIPQLEMDMQIEVDFEIFYCVRRKRVWNDTRDMKIAQLQNV